MLPRNKPVTCCAPPHHDPLADAERASLVSLAKATISHHLKKLADAGLVRSERSGLWNYYEIEAGAAGRLETLTTLIAPA